jgi:hypothetical protein
MSQQDHSAGIRFGGLRGACGMAAGVATATALFSGLPMLAQVSDANVRAVNLARNWAITTNGGLSVYVPESCMFKTADGGGSCLVQSNSQGFFFRFRGGAPGWQQLGTAATRETDVQISPDGRTVMNVSYNGRPR